MFCRCFQLSPLQFVLGLLSSRRAGNHNVNLNSASSNGNGKDCVAHKARVVCQPRIDEQTGTSVTKLARLSVNMFCAFESFIANPSTWYRSAVQCSVECRLVAKEFINAIQLHAHWILSIFTKRNSSPLNDNVRKAKLKCRKVGGGFPLGAHKSCTPEKGTNLLDPFRRRSRWRIPLAAAFPGRGAWLFFLIF